MSVARRDPRRGRVGKSGGLMAARSAKQKLASAPPRPAVSRKQPAGNSPRPAGSEPPSLRLERLLWSADVQCIAGVDEAGRGSWAGPVVAAAVILDRNWAPQLLETVRDSKQLTARERTSAAALIRNQCVSVSVGIVPAEIVDFAGLAFAGQLAFWRAVRGLDRRPDYLLVDGFPLWSEMVPQAAIFQGDARCLSIAAASIIAKVTRDELMASLEPDASLYGFAQHKGYSSRAHREALRLHGPSVHHRRSFKPVAEICFPEQLFEVQAIEDEESLL